MMESCHIVTINNISNKVTVDFMMFHLFHNVANTDLVKYI